LESRKVRAVRAGVTGRLLIAGLRHLRSLDCGDTAM